MTIKNLSIDMAAAITIDGGVVRIHDKIGHRVLSKRWVTSPELRMRNEPAMHMAQRTRRMAVEATIDEFLNTVEREETERFLSVQANARG